MSVVEIFWIAAASYGWCMKWKNPCPVHKEYKKGSAASTALYCATVYVVSGERCLYFWKAPSHQPTYKSKQRTGERKQIEIPLATQEHLQHKASALFPAAGFPAPPELREYCMHGADSPHLQGTWSRFSTEASFSCSYISLWCRKEWGQPLLSLSLVYPSLARGWHETNRKRVYLSGVTWSHPQCPVCDSVSFASSLKLIV